MKKIKVLLISIAMVLVLGGMVVRAGALISDFTEPQPCQENTNSSSDSIITDIINYLLNDSNCPDPTDRVGCDNQDVKRNDDGGTNQNPVGKNTGCQ